MSKRDLAMSDFDAKFMQDEDLRNLLRQWSAPDVPGSLDDRVASAYQQVMSSPAALSNSAVHSQRDSEVVAMKFCSTCQEQFADRFSFCPVDGSPLSVVATEQVSAPAKEIETHYPTVEKVAPQRAAAEAEYLKTPPAQAPAFAAAAA